MRRSLMAMMSLMHLNAINPGHRAGEMRLQHTQDNYRFITAKTFTHLDH